MWCHLFLLSSLVFILFFTHLLIYFSILIFLMFLFLYTSYWFITMLVLYIFPFWNLFFFVCESTFFSFLLFFFFVVVFGHILCVFRHRYWRRYCSVWSQKGELQEVISPDVSFTLKCLAGCDDRFWLKRPAGGAAGTVGLRSAAAFRPENLL